MAFRYFQNFYETIKSIGIYDNDSEETKLSKNLLIFSSLMMSTLAIGWGFLFLMFKEPLAASIPLCYSVFTYSSIIFVARGKGFQFFKFMQLLFPLLLPFFLQISLGGFISGSAVIFWSLSSPLGALVFSSLEQAKKWFIAYIALIIISALLEPLVHRPNNLPPIMIIILFVMNISFTSFVAFVLLQYFVSQKNNTLRLLGIEQEKSDNLLLNILPKAIANILKNENRTIADHYEGASILFADVVNFTPMSATMEPVQLVELLNEVFSYFDRLVEKYDLEKIKTIGDCYMAAAGVPVPRSDHAHVLVRMALEIREYTSNNLFQGHRLAFRIGINSGSIVAGVIGRKKFIYDLWGDAVNTASRMESHGQSGQIQITREAYELIKDGFICKPCGVINVKGKGEMEVWHVLAER